MVNSTKKIGCLTKPCIEASYRISEYVDDQVDPCEDFNKFACGRFQKKTIIPDDRATWNSFAIIQEEIDSHVRKLIEAPISNKDDFESYKKAKKYYKSCMNEEKQNELGFKPLKEILSKVRGWPVLEGNEWTGEDFNVWNKIVDLKHIGFPSHYFSSYFIEPDAKNNSHRVLRLDAATLGLPKVMSA